MGGAGAYPRRSPRYCRRNLRPRPRRRGWWLLSALLPWALSVSACTVQSPGTGAVEQDLGTSAPEPTVDPEVIEKVIGARPGLLAEGGDGPELPLGGRRIHPGHVLVAYYGTAGTEALGVLGEDTPDRITRRLRRQSAPYGADGREVQIVYELIVTIADAVPGPDGDYSHDISRKQVRRYVRAAERNRALLVLDLQPGRSDFVTVAKRWRWALRHPWVGLALDPEWRMAPGEVPGRTIGSVRAAEVNRVSRLVSRIARRHDHPQKLFVVHQFRTDMVRDIDRVVRRKRLAMVQHVDGFGTRRQKLDTYHTVGRPDLFHMGFKLFYDEDADLFDPGRVLAIRPQVTFVSYQ